MEEAGKKTRSKNWTPEEINKVIKVWPDFYEDFRRGNYELKVFAYHVLIVICNCSKKKRKSLRKNARGASGRWVFSTCERADSQNEKIAGNIQVLYEILDMLK